MTSALALSDISVLCVYTWADGAGGVGCGAQRKSGLGVQVLEWARVCPRKAAVGDTLSVHFTGTLKDGTVFDESFKVRLGSLLPSREWKPYTRFPNRSKIGSLSVLGVVEPILSRPVGWKPKP